VLFFKVPWDSTIGETCPHSSSLGRGHEFEPVSSWVAKLYHSHIIHYMGKYGFWAITLRFLNPIKFLKNYYL
jgi:hypothetical protein